MFAPFRQWGEIDNESFSVDDEKYCNTGIRHFAKDIYKYTIRLQKARTWKPDNSIKNILKVESMVYRDSTFIIPTISKVDRNGISFDTPLLDTDNGYVTLFFTIKGENVNKMAKYVYASALITALVLIVGFVGANVDKTQQLISFFTK